MHQKLKFNNQSAKKKVQKRKYNYGYSLVTNKANSPYKMQSVLFINCYYLTTLK